MNNEKTREQVLLGQMVMLGRAIPGVRSGALGVCLRRDDTHTGILFRGGMYDEFTAEQMSYFVISPLEMIDMEACGYEFVSVTRTCQDYRDGHFAQFQSVIFPNEVPYDV